MMVTASPFQFQPCLRFWSFKLTVKALVTRQPCGQPPPPLQPRLETSFAVSHSPFFYRGDS